MNYYLLTGCACLLLALAACGGPSDKELRQWKIQAEADEAAKVRARAAAEKANAEARAEPTSKWIRIDDKSTMDDTVGVMFSLEAENEISGWLESKRPRLIIRCYEKSTNAYIVTGMQASVESGNLDSHTVVVRFDDQKALKQEWSESTDSKALFSGRAMPFAKAIGTSKRLRVQFTPFNANPQIIEFNVSGFAPYLKELATVCKWK
jgi:type VI secretion system VasI family protein